MCSWIVIMPLYHVSPFYVQLIYFLVISLLGFLALRLSKPTTTHDHSSCSLSNFDVFFTSVSASTVSSMSTLEMEVFSNTQLIIITILMFVGGEVFTSMLGVAFRMLKYSCNKGKTSTHRQNIQSNKTDHLHSKSNHEFTHSSLKFDLNKVDQIELVLTSDQTEKERSSSISLVPNQPFQHSDESFKYSSIRHLMYAVLLYLSICHFLGSWFVSFYMIAIPSAWQVLKGKGIRLSTFSVFTVVSTFANCGFVPTNENMIVFKKNSGLLLLVIPHVLLGNTLYPPCLRLLIWALKKVTKREEYNYILMTDHHKDLDYDHLLPPTRSCLLVATTFVFIAIQVMLLCIMEWNSDSINDLGFFQKLVASLFQSVNSRHAGESVFDISTISPAIWVLFVFMMYLPPYTTFSPMNLKDHKHIENQEKGRKGQKGRRNVMDQLLFSQLTYLVIFIILICITEREKLREDPLNFNVMNITMEVVSAYGNVGLTMGYSCKRQIKADGFCTDSWAGFVGRWSTKGKLILVVVMFFGRLKKFSTNCGKAWKLS